MMKKFFLLLLFSIPLFLMAGGPWISGKGKGYFQLSVTSLQYGELLDGFNNPNIGLKREVTDLTLQAYLEYGLTERLDLQLVLPFKILRTGDELLDPVNDNYPEDTVAAGSMHAFSNTFIGAKYLLGTGSYQISAKMLIGANSASYDSATGLRSGYDAWMLTPSVSIGRGFGNFYFFTEAGYRFKSNSYSNDFLFTAEAGYRFDWDEKISTWIILVLDGDIKTSLGYYQDNRSLHTGLYVDGEGYVSPGIKINQKITESLYVNFGIYGALWAEDHGAAPTLNAGLAWDW